jgi:hypothetical protein
MLLNFQKFLIDLKNQMNLSYQKNLNYEINQIILLHHLYLKKQMSHLSLKYRKSR